MSGTAEHNIERVMLRGQQYTGRASKIMLPVEAWRASNLDLLTSSSTIKTVSIGTLIRVIQIPFNSGAASPIRAQIKVDDRFRDPDQVSERKFTANFQLRKLDAASDENATLTVAMAVTIWRANAKIALTSDMVSAVLAAAKIGDNTTVDGFQTISFDVAAALNSDSGKRIHRGDTVELALYPSANVGTTDMVLQIRDAWVDVREHFVNVVASSR